MKKEIKCRYKGFTLVEIIVVLVILAILAATMLPSLIGYINKARNQKYIDITRDFVMAAQGGLVEAYGLSPESFDDGKNTGAVRTGGSLAIAQGKKYGYITNGYGVNSYKGIKMDVAGATIVKGDKFKKAVCNYLGNYLENKNLKVATSGPGAETKASQYQDKCAFVLAFNDKAKVIFVQFAYEGKMVTYDGNSFVVEDNGAFLPYSN